MPFTTAVFKSEWAVSPAERLLGSSARFSLRNLVDFTAMSSKSIFSVLVVDDNEMNRDVLSRRLEKEEINVTTAENGREALEMLEVEAFDLVLLDLMMPDVDGFTVLKTVKSNLRLESIPIIMVTAANDTKSVVNCINLGAVDYIAKPFDSLLLKSRVWRQLTKKTGQAQTTPNPNTVPKQLARILVVDDGAVNRELLETRLKKYGHYVFAVGNGSDAIKELKEKNYDLVLLDIMMPHMDGFQVLSEIRQIPRLTRTSVIMVSAVDDPHSIKKCMALGASDYIAKPFNSVILKARIDSFLMANTVSSPVRGPTLTLLSDVRERVECGDFSLPTITDVATTIMQLTMDENVAIHDITKIIKVDSAITAKLISIANSNVYQGLNQIDTLEDAIVRIGFDETKQYVVALAHKQAFSSLNGRMQRSLEGIWQHSVGTACCAKTISRLVNIEAADRIFTMALLHDIGMPVILKLLAERQTELDGDVGVDQIVFEHHAQVGGYVLEKLGFPREFIDVTENHHEADLEKVPLETRIVVFADRLVSSLFDDALEPSFSDLDRNLLAGLVGIDEEVIDAILAETMQELDKIKNYG